MAASGEFLMAVDKWAEVAAPALGRLVQVDERADSLRPPPSTKHAERRHLEAEVHAHRRRCRPQHRAEQRRVLRRSRRP